MSWNNVLDFEKDLYAFSDHHMSPHDEPEPPPISIAQWNALMDSNRGKSIYDTNNYEADVVMFSSGRGRGGRSEYYRPGVPPISNSTSNEDDIRRRLREVNPRSDVNTETAIRMNNNVSEYENDVPELQLTYDKFRMKSLSVGKSSHTYNNSSRKEDTRRQLKKDVNYLNSDVSEYDIFCDAPAGCLNGNYKSRMNSPSVGKCSPNDSISSSPVLQEGFVSMPHNQIRQQKRLYSDALKDKK